MVGGGSDFADDFGSIRPVRTRDDDNGTTTEDGGGPAASAQRAARTGSNLSPRHRAAGSPTRPGGTRSPSPTPFSLGGAQAHVQASLYGPGGASASVPLSHKRPVGVLEFEADAAGGPAGAAAGGGIVFSDEDDEDDSRFGGGVGGGVGGGGELLQGTWHHYPGAEGGRRCCGLDVSWAARLLQSLSPADDDEWARGGGVAGAAAARRRCRLWCCCRLLAALVAVGAFAALAVVMLKGGGAGARLGASGEGAAGEGAAAARLPRVRLPPPPAMAVGSRRQTPLCSWDSLQLPGAVRPVRYSLHLSAQLDSPYVVRGVARVALEAAESTPCVVLHAELDARDAERAVAGAAAYGRAAGAGASAAGGRLPAMPPLARPWAPGPKAGEQGMRIVSARLYFDGDALEEAAERRQQQQQEEEQRRRGEGSAAGGGRGAAAPPPPLSSAWALPSPAASWPARPPPGFRAGEDYVDGAVYNASSARGQVTLFFPRAVRAYPPSQRARAADQGLALPRAMLELSFNYTLGTGLDGFYRSSWTDPSTGAAVTLASTQLQALAARRAFPCFDEPAMKAPLDVAITAPHGAPEDESEESGGAGRRRLEAATKGPANAAAPPVPPAADRLAAAATTVVLANMPLSRVAAVPGRPDLLTHVFRRTPPMSTYLVAFVLAAPSSSSSSSSPGGVGGDGEPALSFVEKQCELPLGQAAADALARRARAVAAGLGGAEEDDANDDTEAFWGPDRGGGGAPRSVPVRVFGAGGADAAARRLGVALGAACSALQAFEQVLGVPFALPKLDLVAVPNFAAGAMENWGLMLFRESALLVGSAEHDSAEDAFRAAAAAGGGDADAAQAFRVASVVAHEVAHQWFGNLVTLADWTELWLNEGFATYFENVGAAHFRPEFGYFDFFQTGKSADALREDAEATSHPLSLTRPPRSAAEVDDWFDSLSYDKGAAVLRMLRAWLSRAAPARGVAVAAPEEEEEEGEEDKGGEEQGAASASASGWSAAISAAGGANANGFGLLAPPRGPAQTLRRRRRSLQGIGATSGKAAPAAAAPGPAWSAVPEFGLDGRGRPAAGSRAARPVPETELSRTAPGGGGAPDPFLSSVRLYLRRRAFRASDYTALWAAFEDATGGLPVGRWMRAWTLRRNFPVLVAAEVPPPDPSDGGAGDPASASSRAAPLWPVRVEQEPHHSLPAFRTGKPPSPDYFCNDMTDDVAEAAWWVPLAWQEGALPPLLDEEEEEDAGAAAAAATANPPPLPSKPTTGGDGSDPWASPLSVPDPGRARWQEVAKCETRLAGAALPQPPPAALAPGLRGGGNSNGTEAAVRAPVDPRTGNRRFVLLNSGRYGYYRTNYTAQLWEGLAEAAADPRALAAVDLAGLLSDSAALSDARMLSPAVLLRLAAALGRRSTFALAPGKGSGATWVADVGSGDEEEDGAAAAAAALPLLPPPLPLEHAPWAAAAEALSSLRVLLDTAGLREPRWARCASDLKTFVLRNVTGPAVRAHGLARLLEAPEEAAALDRRESAGGVEAAVRSPSGGAAASSASSTGYVPYPASMFHSVVPIGTRLIRPRVLLLAGEMGDRGLALAARDRLLEATAAAAAEASSSAAAAAPPSPRAARKAAAAARRAFAPDATAAAYWLAVASGDGEAYARMRLVYAGADAAELERAQSALAAAPSPERAASTLAMALDPRLTKSQDAARLVQAVGSQGGARLAAAWEFLFSREGGGRLFKRYAGGGGGYALGGKVKALARLLADNGASLPRLEAFAKAHSDALSPTLVDVAREAAARHEDWLQAQGGGACAWLRREVGV